jgi:hypothetical protein
VVFSVPGEDHDYRFKDFANGVRQSEKFGNVSVTLASFGRNGAVYEARLSVNLGASAQNRNWLLSNEAFLVDAKDTKIMNVGKRYFQGVGNSANFSYLFQINGDPKDYELVFTLPGTFTEVTAPFVLTDIPLP